MAATIGDVAAAAGVSRSTVSYALSGNRPISTETRERIARAIEELGFTPNAGARALASAQTRVLGLYLQFHEDEFAPAMLQYVLPISTAARERGYDILMVTDSELASAIKRTTSSAMVDGVILLDVTQDDDRLEPLRRASQPAVLIGFASGAADFDAVDLDFEAAGRMVIDRLAAAGHRRVALVAPAAHVTQRGGTYGLRFRGAVLGRAEERGVSVVTVDGDSRQPGIDRALRSALEGETSPSALIVHNDATVAALPGFLHARGLRVPEDLSVVGVFSDAFGRDFSLPYSSIETKPDQLGREAVDLLVGRILRPGTPNAPASVLVAPEFVDRKSVRQV